MDFHCCVTTKPKNYLSFSWQNEFNSNLIFIVHHISHEYMSEARIRIYSTCEMLFAIFKDKRIQRRENKRVSMKFTSKDKEKKKNI